MENKQIYILPGELKASRIDVNFVTVLGTCISVCMYDKTNKVGGMNHFLLPIWDGSGLATPRYGNVAIDKLLTEMINNGAQKKNIVAKVFGGMIKHDRNLEFSVGRKNIEFTFEKLKELGIKIEAYDVGKEYARKILMNSADGSVKMKRVYD